MTYRVIWLESTLDRLAKSYVPLWGTPEGVAVTEAMARIDRRLDSDAPNEGESRTDVRRLLYEAPLWVEFEYHDDHRTAVVTDGGYRPPGPR